MFPNINKYRLESKVILLPYFFGLHIIIDKEIRRLMITPYINVRHAVIFVKSLSAFLNV